MLKEKSRVVLVDRPRYEVEAGAKGTVVMVDKCDSILPYLVTFDADGGRPTRTFWVHAYDVKEIVDYTNYNLR